MLMHLCPVLRFLLDIYKVLIMQARVGSSSDDVLLLLTNTSLLVWLEYCELYGRCDAVSQLFALRLKTDSNRRS